MLLTSYFTSMGELLGTMQKHSRLLVALAKRDLSDDYVNHSLPIAWQIIQPLFAMLVYLGSFTLIWPIRVSAPSGVATDAVVYLLAGIIPWVTLSQIMGKSMMSVVNNSNIVKQMAFPLELLPLKSLATPLLFGGIELAFVVVYAAWQTNGAILLVYLWGIPLLILITLLFYIGIALLLSCLQVFTRDLKEIVTLFLTVGLFIHPILYLPGAIPAAVRPIIYLSPFSYLLFCWQDILFYGEIHRPWAWIIAASIAALFFMFGARLFVGAKHHFGDFL